MPLAHDTHLLVQNAQPPAKSSSRRNLEAPECLLPQPLVLFCPAPWGAMVSPAALLGTVFLCSGLQQRRESCLSPVGPVLLDSCVHIPPFSPKEWPCVRLIVPRQACHGMSSVPRCSLPTLHPTPHRKHTHMHTLL